MRCEDIITTIEVMKKRGCEFLKIPETYYDNLRKGLAASKVNVAEDLDTI